SGTDTRSSWLLRLFAAAVATVLSMGCWRGLRRVGSRARLSSVALASAAAGVVLVVVLGGGPLRFSPRPWNARAFDGALTGHVVREVGETRGLVSAAANADGKQRALMRADLLIEPDRLEETSFQLEFLPSGMLCTG